MRLVVSRNLSLGQRPEISIRLICKEHKYKREPRCGEILTNLVSMLDVAGTLSVAVIGGRGSFASGTNVDKKVSTDSGPTNFSQASKAMFL